MNKIINFAQFRLRDCPDLLALGAVELPEPRRNEIKQIVRFQRVAIRRATLVDAAKALTRVAIQEGATHILFHSYPFLASYVEREMAKNGINVLYADSVRPRNDPNQPYRLKTLIPAPGSELPSTMAQQQKDFLS